MGWATSYIADLKAGKTVQFRPRGNSMSGKVESGQLVTVTPQVGYNVGDIVLCSVNGQQYLHLVTAKADSRYQISNNRNHVNGWTAQVYGKCTKIED